MYTNLMLRFLAGISLGLTLGAGALLLQSAEKPLFVNGMKSSVAARVEGEEIFVAASALKAAGAGVTVTEDRVSIQFVPLKGMEEQEYIDGVIGEYVSNERWRFKVHSVEPIPNPFTGRGPGVKLTLEVRYLGERPASLHGTGLDYLQVLDEGDRRMQAVAFDDRFKTIQPGGSFTVELKFGNAAEGFTSAKKLIIQFRAFGGPKLKPVRINLRPE